MDVLVHHQPHEFGMIMMIVEGQPDIGLQRFFGAHGHDRHVRLGRAYP